VLFQMVPSLHAVGDGSYAYNFGWGVESDEEIESE
jgi:hypothetical protein